MVEETKNGYIRRTSSGVMKCGSSLSFGSKAKNAEWDEHFKKVDAKMKRDKNAHGIWSNRPIYEGQYIHRKSGNRKNIIFSVSM
jgi:hypothetical protein